MIELHKQNDTQSVDGKKDGAYQILRDIASNKYGCYHCINSHTTYDNINEILKLYDASVGQQIQLGRLRLVLTFWGRLAP